MVISIKTANNGKFVKWWKNFVEHVDSVNNNVMVDYATLNRAYLPEYNAKIDMGNSEYIEFSNEADAIAFILKWS